MSYSPSIFITVDAVVISKEDQHNFVLLIKRKNEPFKNQWAFPGGFVEKEELVQRACQRELKEETGLGINEKDLSFLDYYDQIGRDPRSRTITFAFTAFIDSRTEVKGDDDAAEARWFDAQHLPKLAFDHSEIIRDALHKIL
ncbi:NUDIX domain-containing protein [Psychroflexus sediminis]|uniref:8-oxo-dGTP diphosphatase n=1 Tax=Psychroflexus sediminis TaxID=470826 RepID=A0A1G7XFP4_9FLAO|nr:NUDIX hydrolase [Psychroflexus sediminis]SDG83088.1 8-oxo-dGTP diphosphatase [Psychroflexus sediminis]